MVIETHIRPELEAYWMPGCSSCLRMKEFIERSGRDYTAINVDEHPEARTLLNAHGMLLPVARIGDRFVNGVDLAAVADLIGVDYEAPKMLSPAELVERYNRNLDVARSIISEMTDEMLAYTLPSRKRPMLDVACQVASVARAFLEAYEDDHHTTTTYTTPDEVRSREDVLARLDETRRLINSWWEADGFDDPLDWVTHTYWGYPTLHEVLEREVWHTTQHTRQLQHVLNLFGVEARKPLTAENLAGLPLPERIHD
jgi:glutaredoxin